MKSALRSLCLVFAVLAAAPAVAKEPPLLRRFFVLDATIDRAPVRLEAMEVRPRGAGPFPLAIIAHGKDSGEEKRRAQSALGLTAQATAFARRGFVAVVAMRRGYGTSQGQYAESDGSCEATRFAEASKAGARDLVAIVAAAAALTSVDRSRILVIGESVGGVAALALAALPPPGVVGAINFAGGRGGDPARPGQVCQQDRLVEAVRGFGAAGKIPTLWLYAENDEVFPPALARAMFQAYSGAGGKARLAMLPAIERGGHGLFQRAPERWNPVVDEFLAGLRLPTLRLDESPSIPPRLGTNGQAAFAEYAVSGFPFKAFANSGQGPFGWAASLRSITEARETALANCTRTGKPCAVVSDESLIEDR